MATPKAARALAAVELVEDAQLGLFGSDPMARSRRMRELRRVDSYMREFRNERQDDIKQMLAMMYFAAQSEFAAGRMDRFFEYGSRWLSYMAPQMRSVEVADGQGGATTFTWAQGAVQGADSHDPV